MLVGLPLLGLAGVLRTGRSLVAPITIDGNWKIQGDSSRVTGQSCSKTSTSLLNSSIVISQSGRSLALTFNTPSKIPASGTLDGTSLKVLIAPPRDSAAEAGCGGDLMPPLRPPLIRKSEPSHVVGDTNSQRLCVMCAIEFRAVRQPKAPTEEGGTLMLNLFTLVLQLAVVLAVCRLVGEIFLKIHQPRVVGEMFAGIMLGPSLLGWLAPNVSAYLFPVTSLGFLNALAQVGVVIFMFLVGLGINPGN